MVLMRQASAILQPGVQFLNREARRSSWEASDGLWNPTPGGAIPQNEKAGTKVRPFPHMYLCFLKKT